MEEKHIPQKLQSFHQEHNWTKGSAVRLRSQLKKMMVRICLRPQGLQEKEASMLSLLLFQFFGRQLSASGKRIGYCPVPQRVCPLQEGEMAP
jgi:hypothetical protein